MLSAFGLSHSADAAVAFARAVAAGIGGSDSIISVSGVRKLRDGMFQAFCQVCGSSEKGENQANQAGQTYDQLLRYLAKCPWMLRMYPWVLGRSPQMFKMA